MTIWKALKRVALLVLGASLGVAGLILDWVRSGSLAPLNRLLGLTGWSPLTFAALLLLWLLLWSVLWLMAHGSDRLRLAGDRYGLEFLPHGWLERRRIARLAWARRVELVRDFLSGSVTPGDLLPVITLGLPVSRAAERRILAKILKRNAPTALEVYADRGEGMSLVLAQLAVSLAGRRAVVFSSWPALEARLEGAELPESLQRPLALSLHKAPYHGWLRPPWIILDDCPPRIGQEASEGSGLLFQRFLGLLDSRGIRYVIGVRRYRFEPTVEQYTGWLGMSQQVPLSLDASDVESIASRWAELSGPHVELDVRAWLKRNRTRFKRQLFPMLSLLWAELSSRPEGRYPELRSVLEPYHRLGPKDQLAVRWIAFGQLLDAPLPEEVLERSLGASVAGNAASGYEGVIRRCVDERLGMTVYRVDGPLVAYDLLREELRSDDRFYDFCAEFAKKSLKRRVAVSASYWRRILNRMVSRWNPSLDSCEQRRVARRVYSRFKDRLGAPVGPDPITLIAWAATLRKLGESDEAGGLYATSWSRFQECSEDGTTLFKTSLLIGLNDVLPEALSEERCLGLALELADSVRPGGPEQAFELADAFGEVVRRHAADLADDKRSLLLSRAESLAATSATHPAYRRSANNLLARLVGGLFGTYRNEADVPRPDVQEALRYADDSFRSPPDVATDYARKTWQDIRAHRVKALLYVAEHERSGEFLDEAEEHLYHSFVGLPRSDLPDRKEQITLYCVGASEFARLQWKRRGDTELAEEWYEESIRFLESLPEDQRPDAAWEVYWNYAVFERETSPGLLRVVRALEKALDACPGCPQRKEILDSLSVTMAGACHAALSRGRLRAVVRFGTRAIQANTERLRRAESNQERASVAGDLVGILYPRSVPKARRRDLAKLLARDVSAALGAAWREETESLVALKGLVAVVDTYSRYVPRSIKKSLESELLDSTRADELWARRLVDILSSEFLDKLQRGRPRKFNDRLLGLMAPETQPDGDL